VPALNQPTGAIGHWTSLKQSSPIAPLHLCNGARARLVPAFGPLTPTASPADLSALIWSVSARPSVSWGLVRVCGRQSLLGPSHVAPPFILRRCARETGTRIGAIDTFGACARPERTHLERLSTAPGKLGFAVCPCLVDQWFFLTVTLFSLTGFFNFYSHLVFSSHYQYIVQLFNVIVQCIFITNAFNLFI